jgi:hypothetical protein
LRIDALTAATRWGGERMDYGIAIDSLLYRRRKAAEQRGRDGITPVATTNQQTYRY